MRNPLLQRACLAVLMSALASLTGTAQTFTGGLRGSVNDAGGVLPGVSVTIINEGTQVSRDTTTNAAGEYSFSAVPPATYTIRAALTGFKTYERKGGPNRVGCRRDRGETVLARGIGCGVTRH